MADDFALPLFALTLGIQPPRLEELPRWPRAWALSRHSPGQDRLALAMQRPRKRTGHSLCHCLEQAVAQGSYSLQRLPWLMLLSNAHGAQAILPLLQSLAVTLNRPRPDLDLAQGLAWALGQLGRDIVLPIGERFRHAPRLLKDHYCQALWYLGPTARSCEQWLKNHPSEWSCAVLYAMEGWGAPLAIEWRLPHVWLDTASLRALAELAFAQDPADRLYAAQALDGWGPALEPAGKLLQTLLCDSDEKVAQQAWQTRQGLGLLADEKAIEYALRSADKELSQLGRDHFVAQFGAHPIDCLETGLKREDEKIVGMALAMLALSPLSPHQDRLLELLPKLPDAHRGHALGTLARHGCADSSAALLLVPLEQHPMRLLAVQAYLKLQGPAAHLLSLCGDSDAEVARLAVEGVLAGAHPDLILDALEDEALLPGFLSAMERTHFLWYAYALPTFQFDRLAAKVEQLLQHPAQAGRARRLLIQLDVEDVDWLKFFYFNETQRAVAVHLMRRRRHFPDSMLNRMLKERDLSREWLRLLVELTPQPRLSSLLHKMFANAPRSQRGLFLDPLWQMQEEGWQLLLEWLCHEEEGVASEALELLDGWLQRDISPLRRERTAFLQRPFHPHIQSRLYYRLADNLLDIHEDSIHWALELCREDSHSTSRARTFLTRGLGTARRPQILESTLAALAHPRPYVRLQAALLLRLWLPLEDPLQERIRQSAPDSDPRVEFARLHLLHKLGGLTAEQIDWLAGRTAEEQFEHQDLLRHYL